MARAVEDDEPASGAELCDLTGLVDREEEVARAEREDDRELPREDRPTRPVAIARRSRTSAWDCRAPARPSCESTAGAARPRGSSPLVLPEPLGLGFDAARSPRGPHAAPRIGAGRAPASRSARIRSGAAGPSPARRSRPSRRRPRRVYPSTRRGPLRPAVDRATAEVVEVRGVTTSWSPSTSLRLPHALVERERVQEDDFQVLT